MSREAMNEVYSFSPSSGTARLVLLVLADYANGDREAWPSVASLAARANLPKRTVQRALRSLEESHELEIAMSGGGRNRPTRYRVVPRHGATQPTLDGFEEGRHSVTVSDRLNGATSDSETVTPRAEKGVTGGTQVVEKNQKRTSPLGPPRGASIEDWDQVLEHVRSQVPESTFDMWLAPVRLVERRGDVLVLQAPDQIAAWVRERFMPLFESSAALVHGAAVTVQIPKSETEVQREMRDHLRRRGKRRART